MVSGCRLFKWLRDMSHKWRLSEVMWSLKWSFNHNAALCISHSAWNSSFIDLRDEKYVCTSLHWIHVVLDLTPMLQKFRIILRYPPVIKTLLLKFLFPFNRKIVIHDASPFLFSTFVNYLYSGQLETKELSVDQLADLMLLSDRYEVDSLKQACEQGLKRHIDEDSVLYFLSMGDQFNAKLLRVSIRRYLWPNKFTGLP